MRAPRHLWRVCTGLARGGWLMAVLCLAVSGTVAHAREITEAWYTDATSAYPHGVLGDDEEWAELRVKVTRTAGTEGGLFSGSTSVTYRIVAPEGTVFEDTAPRLWDVTGDGAPEVVTVQSSQTEGARLLIVGLVDGRPEYIAGTGHIGTRFRWLAPVGAADFDGDGHIEIAFVDRPHLAKTLRVWRYTEDSFTPVASLKGVSNHRIGEDFISGGVRDCGDGPEMVLAEGNWQSVVVVRLSAEEISGRRVGAFEGPESIARALACE